MDRVSQTFWEIKWHGDGNLNEKDVTFYLKLCLELWNFKMPNLKKYYEDYLWFLRGMITYYVIGECCLYYVLWVGAAKFVVCMMLRTTIIYFLGSLNSLNPVKYSWIQSGSFRIHKLYTIRKCIDIYEESRISLKRSFLSVIKF